VILIQLISQPACGVPAGGVNALAQLLDGKPRSARSRYGYPRARPNAIDTGSQVSVADVKVQQDPGSPHRITAHSQVGSVSVYNG
jgi:hypothetical protein